MYPLFFHHHHNSSPVYTKIHVWFLESTDINETKQKIAGTPSCTVQGCMENWLLLIKLSGRTKRIRTVWLWRRVIPYMLTPTKGDDRVSDCYLTSTQQFCSAIWWREQVNFQWNDDEVCFLLDQHAYLDLYSASSLKQTVRG